VDGLARSGLGQVQMANGRLFLLVVWHAELAC